jgi:hypothetical protein
VKDLISFTSKELKKDSKYVKLVPEEKVLLKFDPGREETSQGKYKQIRNYYCNRDLPTQNRNCSILGGLRLEL